MPDRNHTNTMPSPVLVTWGWPRERYANGAVSYTAEIVAGMRRMGAQPQVATYCIAGGDQEPFVSQIPRLKQGRGRAMRLALAVSDLICPYLMEAKARSTPLLSELHRLKDEAGIDICEVEEAHGTARHLAGRSPIPIVVRLHGPWFLNGAALGVKRNKSFRRRVADEGRGIAAARGVTAPSRSVLEAVRSFYGFSSAAAEVIPNPVSPAAEKERWSLQTCEPGRILFVGRFDRHKGGDVMIDALAGLRRIRPDCRLTFVGPDTGVINRAGRPMHLKDYIAARMPAAFEGGTVEWLEPQPPGRLMELRRRAMVIVVCSRYENFPMAVLEGMALGCPVVATHTGGIPEIVQHERNGLTCRPGNVDDLTEKIIVLLRNPEFAARLGAQAAVDVEARYHPDKIARQTLAFYRRVIDGFKVWPAGSAQQTRRAPDQIERAY